MLADVIAKFVEDFDGKQDALIEAVGANFKKIITEQMLSAGVNFGKPPFIVDDGDVALLVIDKNGGYRRLPPTFELSAKSTKKGYDALYSLPILNFGLVRFIPAPAKFNFPPEYQPRTALLYSEESLQGIATLLSRMSNAMIELAELRLAKKLIGMQSGMMKVAKSEDVDFDSFMKSREVMTVFVSVSGQALSDGLSRAMEMFEEATSDQGDES